MDLAIVIAGAALILVGIYDVFRTLFLPSGKGLLSEWVAHGVWRGARLAASRRQGVLALAGPAAFISSALTWGLLLSLGFALVYWPLMPGGFSYSPGLIPILNATFLDAFYLSLVTIATLGFGEITPRGPWLRLVVPFEALLGFMLWTAAISWLLSIYPDLSRRQAFAREVSLLRSAEASIGADITALGDPAAAAQILSKLTSAVIAIRGDLQQFSITYYFHENEEESSLPVVMPYVLDLADRASLKHCPPEVRLHALRLQGAVDDLAETLATRFLSIPAESTRQVLDCFARDHNPARADH